MIVRTNNVPRLTIAWNDLTTKEQAEFDWIAEDDRQSHNFVRYQGFAYSLSEFIRAPHLQPKWDGVHNTSMTTGVLVKLSVNDSVVMGVFRS